MNLVDFILYKIHIDIANIFSQNLSRLGRRFLPGCNNNFILTKQDDISPDIFSK